MNILLKILDRIITKLFSGRFLSFMMITWTLCYAVILSLNTVLGIGKVDADTKDIIEKVSMFILGAFVTIATGIYKEYWDQDRQKKGENNEKNDVINNLVTDDSKSTSGTN